MTHLCEKVRSKDKAQGIIEDIGCKRAFLRRSYWHICSIIQMLL